ncbi:tetratricopeptide repeat protein [Parabacteroides sp. PF5-6]|uniref:tetratricopeptide repeat protein n=1 Tax=Parabacteroides sp. PF5-6 TaxID=1742403 RepID=UPI0024062958|nr:tetratricopeptide repeat protein [Parabacteroides sp. PF5-6]MDF9830318.1 lipoprotein NlpI [Parabacteroides sp. PF5-6]
MKPLLLPLLLLSLSLPLLGQETAIDSLVHLGIEHHDAGAYEKAITFYRQALTIDPNAEIVLYELAISLAQTGAHYEAIEYCDKLIDRGDKYAILAYNTKGSCLNDLGKTEEAIDVFLEGIEKEDEFHLLYYNLGLAYRNLEEYEEAKEAFLIALDLNPQHGGSHLNLGRTMMNLNRRVESLLSLYYFLFIETDTERAEWAYNAIQLQLSDATARQFDPKDPFSSTDMILNEIARHNLEFDRIGDMEIFIRTTGAFFTDLGDQQKKNKEAGLYWEFYIPFFSAMASAAYTDAFCHYISHSFNNSSEEWLRRNSTKVKLFNDWLQWQ